SGDLQAHAPVHRRVDRAALLVGVLAFCAFMPYPAYNVGNNTAVQIGNVLSILMVLPLLLLSWRGRPYYIYLLILIPLFLSFLKTAIAGDGALDLCIKTIFVWGLSCLTLPVIQRHAGRYALPLLTGIALSTVIHFVVGMWQFHGFSAGYF